MHGISRGTRRWRVGSWCPSQWWLWGGFGGCSWQMLRLGEVAAARAAFSPREGGKETQVHLVSLEKCC